MDELKESAKKYTEYDIIAEHTLLPEFPVLRMKVLFAFFRHATEKALPPKLQEVISLAVSLMQHGLDTHEFVDGKSEMRRRQLTVLAGDYFSSRFYQLLSQAGNVQTIGLVSEAVCEVNRCKMNLYSKTKKLLLSAEEYVRGMVEINTRLFVAFSSWMEDVYRKTCPDILRKIAECELISKELGRVRPDNVKESWAYWYVLENGTTEEIDLLVQGKIDETKLKAILLKYNLHGKLADMLDTKVAELRIILRSIRSDKLAEELERLIEPLFAGRNITRAHEI